MGRTGAFGGAAHELVPNRRRRSPCGTTSGLFGTDARGALVVSTGFLVTPEKLIGQRTGPTSAPSRVRRYAIYIAMARRERPPTKPVTDLATLPYFLNAREAAELLRSTTAAVYARAERGALPGAVRDGRRLLIRRDDLLQSLSEGRAPSPGGSRR